MKLNFYLLAHEDDETDQHNLRGQRGTLGTAGVASLSASPSDMFVVGTGGDTVNLSAPIGAAESGLIGITIAAEASICPPASPTCPQPQSGSQTNGRAASPASPPVPNAKLVIAGSRRIDWEAFEERAAIMEFDGGLSRENAEAAAWAHMHDQLSNSTSR